MSKKNFFFFGTCPGLHISFLKHVAPQNSRSHTPQSVRYFYDPNTSRRVLGPRGTRRRRQAGGSREQVSPCIIEASGWVTRPQPGVHGAWAAGRVDFPAAPAPGTSFPSSSGMSLRNNQLLRALSSEPEFSSPGRERECQERRERRGFWGLAASDPNSSHWFGGCPTAPPDPPPGRGVAHLWLAQ